MPKQNLAAYSIAAAVAGLTTIMPLATGAVHAADSNAQTTVPTISAEDAGTHVALLGGGYDVKVSTRSTATSSDWTTVAPDASVLKNSDGSTRTPEEIAAALLPAGASTATSCDASLVKLTYSQKTAVTGYALDGDSITLCQSANGWITDATQAKGGGSVSFTAPSDASTSAGNVVFDLTANSTFNTKSSAPTASSSSTAAVNSGVATEASAPKASDATSSSSSTSTTSSSATTLKSVSVAKKASGKVAATASGTATIAGVVFYDNNANAQYDSGDGYVTTHTVTLKDMKGTVIATTKTDSSGAYKFTSLPAGSYNVYVDSSGISGYTKIWNETGSDIGSSTFAGVDISAGDTGFTNVDFGVKKATSGSQIVSGANSGGGTTSDSSTSSSTPTTPTDSSTSSSSTVGTDSSPTDSSTSSTSTPSTSSTNNQIISGSLSGTHNNTMIAGGFGMLAVAGGALSRLHRKTRGARSHGM